ncbi:MAG: TrkA family potassium uptake protein [Phycisphaerae bacterium]|nr:TrkA family potassium uptake protein [Phycisphaerae bacterium]MDP7290098.1 TrkA family potassium uptake protein [Phycisphaerae bacterium]
MERFAVIGLGRFGMTLAKLLSQDGADVIAVDSDKKCVDAIRDHVSLAVCLDATDAEALKSQGIDKVDVAVVGVGESFEDSVLVTVTLKELEVPTVISRATSRVRAEILARVGADDVVNPEKESAQRWKNRLLAPSIMERIELAEGASLVQLQTPESFHDKTLSQLDLRKTFRVNVVAIRRTVEEIENDETVTRQFLISVPAGDTAIKKGDILILIGTDEAIENLPAN